jgi:hypothetical protein
MSEGPSAGRVMAGILMILFGLCITLVGGGCTLFVLASFSSMGVGSDFGAFLLLSLFTLGVGVLCLWAGMRLLKGGYQK